MEERISGPRLKVAHSTPTLLFQKSELSHMVTRQLQGQLGNVTGLSPWCSLPENTEPGPEPEPMAPKPLLFSFLTLGVLLFAEV